jgi:two-component system, OmpR family, response regulator
MKLSDLNHILYVEDNPQLRCVAKMALEVIGRFQVCDCDSSRNGLIQAADFFPDLILLDVASCNQDALMTLERLRRIPHLRDTPAMFVTGMAAAADVAQYVAAGAIGIIAKPLEPLRLAAQVRQLWANRQQLPGGFGFTASMACHE